MSRNTSMRNGATSSWSVAEAHGYRDGELTDLFLGQARDRIGGTGAVQPPVHGCSTRACFNYGRCSFLNPVRGLPKISQVRFVNSQHIQPSLDPLGLVSLSPNNREAPAQYG